MIYSKLTLQAKVSEAERQEQRDGSAGMTGAVSVWTDKHDCPYEANSNLERRCMIERYGAMLCYEIPK